MSEIGLKFEDVDLTTLQDEGVLMAANERFFWPLGLSLVWMHHDDGTASDLRVRQWEFGDGHVERIELTPDDPVGDERRRRFSAWIEARLQSMTIGDERDAAARALNLGRSLPASHTGADR